MAQNKILFYSSVSDKKLFEIQRFYKIDIEILESLGHRVLISNKISDALYFWRYNAAFIYFYKYGFFVALLARLFLRKVYFTGGIDELDEQYAGRSLFLRQKLFFKLCRAVATCCIIVSRADKENVEKIYGGRLPGKLAFSEHTIDVQSFLNNEVEKEPLFTSIGWMESPMNVSRKGLDKALRLFGFLCNKPEFVDCKFVIIGKQGAGSDRLKQMVADMGLEDRVRFTGAISEPEKIDILSRSRYYFQLSQYEGFGIAALEALAASNIVIHSGRGGLGDTMQDFGIRTDIDVPEYREFEMIYLSLCKYEKVKLNLAKEMVAMRFSSERRAADFSEVIKFR